MKKFEIIIIVLSSILLGVFVLTQLNGPGSWALETNPDISSSAAQVIFPTPTEQKTQPSDKNLPSSSSKLFEQVNTVFFPISSVDSEKEEPNQVLILTTSVKPNAFDQFYTSLANYYGVKSKTITLDTTHLTDYLIQNEQGQHYPLIIIDARKLLGPYPLFITSDIELIRKAVEQFGSNLFIGTVNDQTNKAMLSSLTNGAVTDITKPADSVRDWDVSGDEPDITQQFTGRTFTSKITTNQEDFALALSGTNTSILVSSKDDLNQPYPIFARVTRGLGSIFINTGEQEPTSETFRLSDMYYASNRFSQIVPPMMAMRYALGNSAWHSVYHFANLTIDDPALIEPFEAMSYSELLQQMLTHNFHTTIAFPPIHYKSSKASVIHLFVNNPDRLSLVQHGNNQDGYEFYKYVAEPGDLYPANSLAMQEADIQEGLSRLQKHQLSTRIPFGKIMIFPYGISPEPTLVLLKKYNYLATVNAQKLPLGVEEEPTRWDFDMYQANMDFGNFPTLSRRHPGTYEPFKPDIDLILFDLFIGKPALFYSHANEIFETGMTTFNIVADQMNQLHGGVQWQSLDYILKRLYLEKTNSDGSIDVKMYTNHLILENQSENETKYHINKEETLNIPIVSLTINGSDYAYRVENGLLIIDGSLLGKSTAEIVITYGNAP
jgi:hypothetical protein